jgi:hypothetical protein
MKTIYKYKLDLKAGQVIPMPINAEIIAVKNQDDDLCMWAIIDTDCEVRPTYRIEIYGTGHPMEQGVNRTFLGTCVMPNGLVWHVFSVVIN